VQCANARIARFRQTRATGLWGLHGLRFERISEPEITNSNQGSIGFHSLPPRPKMILGMNCGTRTNYQILWWVVGFVMVCINHFLVRMLNKLPSTFMTLKALFTVVDATVFDSSGRCRDGTSRHEQIKITRKSALTLISFIITSRSLPNFCLPTRQIYRPSSYVGQS
jgi:hypothetical protein